MVRAALIGAALLAGALPAAAAPPASGTRGPGTVSHTWTVRWPGADGERTYTRKFGTRGGLIKRVRVEIAGTSVKGPPYISIVRCRRTHFAAAQKSWVWDGRNVYVLLLLQPAKCAVAGRLERVEVTLTTVGT